MKNNRIVQSIVIGLTTLLAAFGWVGIDKILSEEGNWIWPSICLLILLVFLSLSLVLLKSKTIIIITLATILISFLFSFGFTFEYLIILLISFSFLLAGSLKIINEKKLRIKLKVMGILKCGLPCIMTGLAIIIASAYYFSPLAVQEENEIKIPRKVFDIVFEPVLKGFISEQESVSGMPADPEMIQGLVNTDMIYNKVNAEINKRSEIYEDYLLIGFAIGIFFALKVISIPFMWLVILISWMIFKILKVLNAIKIQEKSVLKEVIET